MKKNLTILLFVFIFIFKLTAVQMPYSLGYELGITGISDKQNNGKSGVVFGLVYTPFDFQVMNPSLKAETVLAWNKTDIGFQDYRLIVNVDLVRTINHPFGFLWSNPFAWCPSIGVGIQKNSDNRVLGYLSLSPLKFMDKDFIYEWFSPFVVLSPTVEQWGIVLLSFSSLVV